MKYSDVVNAGLILPKKLKYTVKDADSVMQNSLFKPYKGRTFTPNEAAFIVRASAIHHGTDYSDALNTYGENVSKRNPAPRAPKRKTSARTQSAAEAYVRRPSQITKKAPSDRLKKRRTINLQTPRGAFPNPSPKLPTYYGSGRTAAHLVGNFTKAGAVRAGNKFLTKDLKDAGFSVSVFESENGYYVINIGKTLKKNPAKRAVKTAPKYFISTKHEGTNVYFDGVGFSKLKSSAVDFRTKENVTKRAVQLADFFNRPMVVIEE